MNKLGFASMLCASTLAHWLTPTSHAAPLSPGDIVVATQSGGAIYVVNPDSGSVRTVRTGGIPFDPNHVPLDPQGGILTATRADGFPGVVRTDPDTAAQRSIADGPLLAGSSALAFARDRNLYVGTLGGTVVHVNLATGSQTLVTPTPLADPVQDVDVDASGRLWVLDFGDINDGGGRILRLDPATGAVTPLATSGALFNPADLLVHPTGDLLVSNRLPNNTTQILRINPDTGRQQVALTVPSEGWIALEDDRTLVYADFHYGLPTDGPSILRADLLTGQTRPITSYRFNANVIGVAVYTPVPEPSALALLGVHATALLLRRRA